MSESDVKIVSIFIRGMSCQSCVAHVEMILKKVPGVRSVMADLSGSRAIIEYEPAVVTYGGLIAPLEGGGYRVSGFTSRGYETASAYAVAERKAGDIEW